ncbi:hypothetical protein Q5H92_05165 [Hymenobacter sp. M29]|uniref:Uncharacterized protein n=1 Tax=Hymenobacter mellowenesis TaxID=3063995 RepID=A0ABT9A7B7_9BACT|nr:hypothetical protein [Hymenobacter sp. M29]MDO7845738.1 hypothetical protein [Hymenobacter sp. M29]
MYNKVFLNNLDLSGPDYPSYDFITDEIWQSILNNLIFKLADSFAFMGVSKKADLFPDGLTYFSNWELNIIGLAEVEDDIVCKFQLNETCKANLLEYDFAVHSFKNKRFNDYYEFDQLCFFSKERLIVNYINHESMLCFLNFIKSEDELIENLEPSIKSSIVDSTTLVAAYESKRNA